MRRAVLDAVDSLTSPLVHERTTRIGAHRPWPMPRGSWVMAQTWVDLLFAHWPLAPERLERLVPAPLELDTHRGAAWVAVTPFAVRNLRLRPTMPVPRLSAFPEINVRTYVVVDGKPGIFFFSLDAGSRAAVVAARRFYRLPYFAAEMTADRGERSVAFVSRRAESPGTAPDAEFRAVYGPAGDVSRAPTGTLEHWLTERYCLYTFDERRRVLRAEIHHPPWPLQPAEADIELNTMVAELGLVLAGRPLLHYAARQDVVFWGLRRA